MGARLPPPSSGRARAVDFYFEDFNIPHRSRVARVRIKDESVETIADLGTLRQISDSWIGCGPGDVPIAVREVGTQEIYALDLNAQ